MRRALGLLGVGLVLALLAPLAGAPSHPEPPSAGGPVVQLAIEGPITRATDLYLEEGLEVARQRGAVAVLVVLNTPGGGLEETFRMTERIGQSGIPVVGFVAPRTAHAWSAGTVVLLSTHVAAMAPFTAIGSSQPVQLTEGGFTPVNDTKIINALVAQMRNLAAAHGRNETAAEEFVTKNLNLNAEDALAAGVIEHVAADVPALLAAIDGVVVETAAGNATLATAGRPVVALEPSVRVALLDVFFNPLVASLLMLVGIYALIFGLGNPGMGAEIAGGIAVILGLVGLGFSVSLAALALIGLGAALLLVELHTPGFGVFGIAGIAALLLGTLFIAPLSPTGPGQWSFPAEYQQQVLFLLALPSIVLAGFFGFAFYKVAEVRRRAPALSGPEGQEAVVTDALGPGKEGFVTFQGERWQATSDWELAPGTRVVVRGKDGPVLRVEPAEPRPPA